MIPVSLTLRNFLSYGEDAPTLDFSTFQIACITGQNGHGKSALFDAITWALWGEARKASSDRKPDEGLLRIGATDLRVEFVFDLDGQRFRVSRAYRKTAKSGSSTLELQVLDPESNRYRALSESSSIRKTQARIDRLVRISYDTFVNSAFILQGRVDEFTRRSPSDRKAILADILELSRYDALGLRAREKARASDAEAVRVRDALARIDHASEQRADLDRKLAEARHALAEAEQRADHLDKQLETCRAAIARAEAAAAQRTALLADRAGLRLRLQETQAERDDAQKVLDRCHAALASRDEIHGRMKQLTRLRKTEEDLRERQTKIQSLRLEQARLESEVAAARSKIEARRDHWSTVVSDLDKSIEAGETALARKPEVEKALRELSDLRKQDNELIALRNRRDEIEAQRRELERVFNTNRSRIQVEIEAGQTKRRELQQILDKRTTVERSYNDARQHLDTFNALNEEMERVKREGTEAQQTEERLKERIEGLGQRRQQLVAQSEQLKAHDDPDCPLCGSELDENHRHEVLQQLAKDIEDLSWQHETASKDLTTAKDRRDTCRAAYQKLRDQVHPLADAPRNFARAEAELAGVSTVHDDLETLVGTLQALEDRAKEYETSSDEALELVRIRKEIDSLSKRTSGQDKLRARIETLAPTEIEKARLDELQKQIETARSEREPAREKLVTAETWLKEKRYSEDAQSRLRSLVQEIDEIGYDAEAHRKVIDEIEGLNDVEADLQTLRSAEQDLAVARARCESSTTRCKEIETEIETAEKALETFGNLDQETAILAGQKANLLEARSDQSDVRDAIFKEVAAIERDVETCQALVAQRPDTVKALAAHEKDVTVYRELVKAFGRDGIQALLIDQAIPELQDEANRILSRLTANGTQITLESLGELKGGGTKETLDIRISDELGERRYELYSGGEAFRVDFAIRIALSKLLAHRSGTPLQTLVIDEGFGTQDEQGLTHLIDAIQTISDEFEKVLVITHVETIKNAFPVRIEVVKHPESGSTFNVVN